METILVSPEMLGVDDPRIKRTADELVSPWGTVQEKAWALARFVREWVDLEVRSDARVAKAPEVLCFRHGSATEKALLLASLCQAVAIQCRVASQTLAGAPATWLARGPSAKAEWEEAHPVNEVLVDGRWLTVDVSLDSETASRVGLMMPALSGDRDATLREAVFFDPDSPFQAVNDRP